MLETKKSFDPRRNSSFVHYNGKIWNAIGNSVANRKFGEKYKSEQKILVIVEKK